MKISIKKYNNDVSKAYKIMMRKLNADGFYTDAKRQSYYISKSEKLREAKKAGKARYRKAEAKRQALMQKLERKAGYTKKQKKTPNSKS